MTKEEQVLRKTTEDLRNAAYKEGMWYGEAGYRWTPTPEHLRRKAHRPEELGTCMVCGKPALDNICYPECLDKWKRERGLK